MRDDVGPQVLIDRSAPALLNNPGGMRLTNEPWEGKSTVQVDPQFVTFDSPRAGIRAMGINLHTYRNRSVRTVESIISTWAPSTENRTEEYIRHVVQFTGFRRDEEIDVRDRATLLKLVEAIVIRENGLNPYRAEVISDGVDSALRDAGQNQP